MKKIFPVIAIVIVSLLPVLTCCHGTSPLERAIKDALVRQDTTAERYDSLCGIIAANPERYSTLLDDSGKPSGAALGALIEKIGSQLRPPMHWDVTRYAMQQLSLTIYFERSGSMVPYDAPGGGGQLKKAVNDLINFFPNGDNATIKIVNDGIYPYDGTIETFLQDRNIYATTQGVGNASFTDFQKIFSSILEAQKPGEVSVVISDLIYSPADTRDVSVAKIFNEENSLATRVFKQHKGKSVVVYKLMGDFRGKYYPYNGQPFEYSGQRPFYIMMIADAKVLDAMAHDPSYTRFMKPSAAVDSYRFNQGEEGVECCVVPDWSENAGRFRVDRSDAMRLVKCSGDKTTGVLCFTLATRLDGLQKDAGFLDDANNYQVHSLSRFTLAVKRITPDMITGNNKAYLDGKTHLLTFTGKLTSPRDEITVRLANEFPRWIDASSADIDTDPHARDFATTTLGLKELLGGINSAFTGTGSYTTITVKLEK